MNEVRVVPWTSPQAPTKNAIRSLLDGEGLTCYAWGNNREKLDWFKIINIAGEKLTDQELCNAVYTGTWLTDAKSIFSKSNCAAYL